MTAIPDSFPIAVIGFAAFSGTGKTTLLKQLIPQLTQRHYRVGIIKQSHHDIEVDTPGKDSYALRKAGAVQTVLACPRRQILIREFDPAIEQDLLACLDTLQVEALDIVLVEGFKYTSFDKIELHRVALDKPLLYPEDEDIIAIATDAADRHHTLPMLDLNDVNAICDFICQRFPLTQAKSDRIS